MKEGRFVQVGTAEEIVRNPADDYVAAFTQDVDRARVFDVDSVMEAPESLDLHNTDAAAARARLDALGRDALHVLDDGKLTGVITRRALDSASGAEGRGSLDGALIRDVPTARRDAHLVSVYQACAAGLPVAVVDDDGALVGTVRPQDIFSVLAEDKNGTDRDAGQSRNDRGDGPTALSA